MARPKLHNADQTFALRTLLRLYEFLASLKLAVVLIFTLAVVLGVATLIEANWGGPGVRFMVYQTGWFELLLALLALNIFCAAAIRYPWKRHQTGFVITHIGLLTLLAGSEVSNRGSLDSQMLVYQNSSSRIAVDQDESYVVVRDLPGRPEPLRVAFSPGPFNWDDLAPYPALRRLKSFVGRDDVSQPWVHPPEVFSDNDGTKVEAVDYYSRSIVRRTPYLALNFRQSLLKFEIPIELQMTPGLGFAEENFGGQGSVMMWRAGDERQLTSFRECIPQHTVRQGGTGAVVIWSGGEVYHLSVVELQKLKESGQPFELEDGRSLELVTAVDNADIRALVEGKGLVASQPGPGVAGAARPAVELNVTETRDGEPVTHRIIRFAEYPSLPNRSQPDDFLVEFYHPGVKGRIDILIGPEDQLVYRVWQQKSGRVPATGELKEGEEVSTWSMGGGEAVWKMSLGQFIPGDGTDGAETVVPLAFDKGDRGISKRVKLRISWKDKTSGERKQDEFWLRQNLPSPWEDPRNRQVHEIDVGADKPIRAEFNVKQTDVGFAVKLVDFDLDVDPGTGMAANYTSHLVQVDVRDKPEIQALWEKLTAASDRRERQDIRQELSSTLDSSIDDYLNKIGEVSEGELNSLIESDDALASHIVTMNEPLDYPDLQGRQLRFFQENYLPPERSGAPVGSIFRVNYDPGRSIKYLGSSLIVLGIFLMFYMRAYFFKRPDQSVARRRAPAETTETQPVSASV